MSQKKRIQSWTPSPEYRAFLETIAKCWMELERFRKVLQALPEPEVADA